MKYLVVLFLALTLSLSSWALPPQIEFDRLLLQAKTALDAKDYALAAQSLSKAETLGVKLPDNFYYHLGTAYIGDDQLKKSHEAFEKYLIKTATTGKYYQQALEGFNSTEIKINDEAAFEVTKSETLGSLRLMDSDFESHYDSIHTYGENPGAPEIKKMIKNFRTLVEAYNENIITPSMTRLEIALKKRAELSAGVSLERLDQNIIKINADIGAISQLNNDTLRSVYVALEELHLIDDARAIERIRVTSFIYSTCDGIQKSSQECSDRLSKASTKFESVLSEWNRN